MTRARLTGYCHEGAAVSTSIIGESPRETVSVTTRTLNEILAESGLEGPIDFLNVDCEGEDSNVLAGLDWDKWKPLVVAVEAHVLSERRQLEAYMASKGYALASQVLVTSIFTLSSAPPNQ